MCVCVRVVVCAGINLSPHDPLFAYPPSPSLPLSLSPSLPLSLSPSLPLSPSRCLLRGFGGRGEQHRLHPP